MELQRQIIFVFATKIGENTTTILTEIFPSIFHFGILNYLHIEKQVYCS